MAKCVAGWNSISKIRRQATGEYHFVTEKEDAQVTPDNTGRDGLITWLIDQEHVSAETAISRTVLAPDIIIGHDKEKDNGF